MLRVLAGLLAGVIAAAAPGAAFTLDEVMTRLAEAQGFRCDFVEHTERSLLAEPEIARGVFLRATSGAFLRATRRPSVNWLWLSSDRLLMAEGGEPATEAEADTFAFFQAFTGFFAGDRPALEAQYTLAFGGLEDAAKDSTPQSWSLTLEPRAEAVRVALESIRLEGRVDATTARITAVEVREANGDRVRLELSNPVEGPWSSAELEAIFRARELP